MGEASSTCANGIAGPRILVMGVGSSGTRAVARMCELNPDLDAVGYLDVLVDDRPADHSAAADLDALEQQRIFNGRVRVNTNVR